MHQFTKIVSGDPQVLMLDVIEAGSGPTGLAERYLAAADLHVALGLASAARDLAQVRAALAALSNEQISADPILCAFRDVTR